MVAVAVGWGKLNVAEKVERDEEYSGDGDEEEHVRTTRAERVGQQRQETPDQVARVPEEEGERDEDFRVEDASRFVRWTDAVDLLVGGKLASNVERWEGEGDLAAEDDEGGTEYVLPE